MGLRAGAKTLVSTELGHVEMKYSARCNARAEAAAVDVAAAALRGDLGQATYAWLLAHASEWPEHVVGKTLENEAGRRATAGPC